MVSAQTSQQRAFGALEVVFEISESGVETVVYGQELLSRAPVDERERLLGRLVAGEVGFPGQADRVPPRT